MRVFPRARSASSTQRCMRDLTISLSRRIGGTLECLKTSIIPSHRLLRRRRSTGTLGSVDIPKMSIGISDELLGTVQSVFDEIFPVCRARMQVLCSRHPIQVET